LSSKQRIKIVGESEVQEKDQKIWLIRRVQISCFFSIDRLIAVKVLNQLHFLITAHIKPYAEEGPHEIRNGLLLREDLHTLFDRGYMTITNQFAMIKFIGMQIDFLIIM
jgi:hypothetical protein